MKVSDTLFLVLGKMLKIAVSVTWRSVPQTILGLIRAHHWFQWLGVYIQLLPVYRPFHRYKDNAYALPRWLLQRQTFPRQDNRRTIQEGADETVEGNWCASRPVRSADVSWCTLDVWAYFFSSKAWIHIELPAIWCKKIMDAVLAFLRFIIITGTCYLVICLHIHHFAFPLGEN